jgi:integrase
MAIVKHRNKWRVEIYHRGKRIYRSQVFTEKLDAEIHEREYQQGLVGINTTFIQLCEARLEELELKRSSKHFKENQSLYKKLVALWGKRKLIVRQDVQDYLNNTARASKATANKHLRLIKALFNFGIMTGILRSNPCLGIQRFPNTPKKRYIPPASDIQKILSIAKPMDRCYLLVMIHTLGRMREVNNLKWEDVDFERRIITLYTRKAKCSDLKQNRVPINTTLEKILLTIPNNHEYIFPNPLTNKPYDHRKKFLGTLCRRADIKPFTFHCLRHFGASLLDSHGIPITEIQAILGHERPTTTDHYLQGIRGGTRTAIEHLDIE